MKIISWGLEFGAAVAPTIEIIEGTFEGVPVPVVDGVHEYHGNVLFLAILGLDVELGWLHDDDVKDGDNLVQDWDQHLLQAGGGGVDLFIP